jgi:heat shock protein HtpX
MQNWRTVLWLGALTGLLMFIGSALGGRGGMMLAFGFAVIMNLGAWWFSDRFALMVSGARPAAQEDVPALYNIVEGLARRAQIPVPRIYIIDSPMPNAFATGRSPQKGAVAVTTGLMELLSHQELAGVIAHELAHIKRRDTLISSVAATIGGAITMLADMALWGMLFGGGDDEENGAGGLLMIFLAPLAALLIQLAISRSREFSADAGGARIMGDPLPLADALEKLEEHKLAYAPVPVNPSTMHLYIVPPMSGGLAALFRTHPATTERVARLRAMTDFGIA